MLFFLRIYLYFDDKFSRNGAILYFLFYSFEPKMIFID